MATNEEILEEKDPQLKALEAEEAAAVGEVNSTYDSMIAEGESKYQAFDDALVANQSTLTQLQNDMTNQAIKEIEQDQKKAEEDYTKEQSAAYVDWQKQSAQHGVNAEQMASQGMTNTGYSESSKVAMYTAYQNRVAVARASFQQLSQDYDNAITNARLQNSVAIAELASKTLESRMQIALEGFKYKNTLLESKLAAATTVKNNYYSRYQDTLDRLQRAEEFQYQKDQNAIAQQNWKDQFEYQKDQDAIAQQNWKDQFEYQKEQDTIAQENWQKEFDAANNSGNPFAEDEIPEGGGTGTIPAAGNENTSAAESKIFTEKEFNRYKNSGRGKVNGKSFSDYQSYVLAKIEDMANNGVDGRQLTDAEVMWLLSKWGDL